MVLPLLKLSEKEEEEMEQEPNEFVNYSVDICQKQKSKTYKTQAAKLLESIVDHVDGMLTFTVNLVVEMISNILSSNGQITSYVQQVMEKFNLKFKSGIELLDVCFMTLTILSYAMVKRNDLLR